MLLLLSYLSCRLQPVGGEAAARRGEECDFPEETQPGCGRLKLSDDTGFVVSASHGEFIFSRTCK